jgi:hypothetical protein
VEILGAEFAAGQSQFTVDALAIFRHATAQAVAESFLLFAVLACLIALIPGWFMRAAVWRAEG